MSSPLKHPIAVARTLPFGGNIRVMQVPVIGGRGASIAEIIAAQSDLPDWFVAVCEARINGELVRRELWGYVRLRPNPCCDVVVTFTMPLGGGGGGKNAMAAVAMIAVMVVAAVVAGPWGVGIATTTFGLSAAAAAIAAPLAGAAIGIGGALAIAALTPPPSLSTNQAQNLSGPNNTAASLSGNILGRGDPVPRVIGTFRLFPPFICPPLIEIVGDDTVGEAVYGLAGPHQISDALVGTTTVASMDNIEIEIQEGLPNSPVLGLVTRQSFTDTTIAVQMSKHDVLATDGQTLKNQGNPTLSCPQWEGMTSRTAPDEVWIHLSFPGGMGINATSRGLVPFRLRIRQSGNSVWINLPEFHIARLALTPFQIAVKLMWQSAPVNRNTPAAIGGPVNAYTSVPQQTGISPISGGWTADSYFYNGSGNTYFNSANLATTGVINTELFTDRVEYYLSDDTKFPKSGTYDIQIMRGQPIGWGDFNPTTYTCAAGLGGTIIKDLFGYLISGTPAAITIRDQSAASGDVAITRVSSIWNEIPVPYPDKFAIVAVRVTNRTVDQLSVLASAYIYDWDGTGWNTLTTTSNPAPHLHDVLTGSLGGYPLTDDVIDNASLVDWRQRCIDQNYECNTVVEGKTYIDVAKILTSSAYAQLVHNEKWGVFQDRDRAADSPIQVFTPRNMKNFSWTKAFARLPTGIRASFFDSNNTYQTAENFIYDDASNPDSDQLEQITYDGLVTSAEVATRARFDLTQAKKRLTFYKGTTDAEAIVCQRGDLVAVENDILDSYSGSSRITAISRSGGNVTGLTLDGSVPVISGGDIALSDDLSTAIDLADFGAQVGAAIRLKGGAGVLLSEVDGSNPSNDQYTVLLLHCSGLDASTGFVDSSESDHRCTATGVTQIDSAQTKFGFASALFGGSTGCIRLDGSADFAFGSRDFTIDFWVRFNSFAGSFSALYDSRNASSTGTDLHIYVTNSTKHISVLAQGADRITGATTLAINTWYHIALARSGTTTKLFLNGTQEGTSWAADNTIYTNPNNRPMIGASGGSDDIGSVTLDGWMDEVRVSNGIARWTTTFTPPASAYADPTYINDELTSINFTTPFTDPGSTEFDVDCLVTVGRLGTEYRRLIVYGIKPNVDMTADITFVDEAPDLFGIGNDQYTNILLHFDGADASTTITDSCKGVQSHIWTSHTGAISTAQSKLGGASYNCGAAAGYVDTPDCADFRLGTADWTIDGWFLCQAAIGTFTDICGTYDVTATNPFVLYRRNTDGGINFLIYPSTAISGTTVFSSTVNTGWHHVAVVRTGNILKLFIDGIQEGGDVSYSGSVNDSAVNIAVGSSGTQGVGVAWNGYLDEFRLSVGIARWTKNFTPPNSPYGLQS